jgi:hypothetical protein
MRTRKLSAAIAAAISITLTSWALVSPDAQAAGAGSCLTGDVCTSSQSAYWGGSSYLTNGYTYGFTTSPYLAGYTYNGGSSVANNVLSIRGRSSTYISFCLFNTNMRTQPIAGGSNIWAWDGWKSVAQGSESALRSTSSVC